MSIAAAHAAFSQIYALANQSEKVYHSSDYDFFTRKTDVIIVTKLKAQCVTRNILAEEVSNCVNQLIKLSCDFGKPAQIRFLAPEFADDCEEYLCAIFEQFAEHNIEYKLVTWQTEIYSLKHYGADAQRLQADLDAIYLV